MPKAPKAESVAELAKKLTASKVAILADYRGLTVAQMSDLRRRLRATGAELQVVKNTLARIAAHQVGISGRESALTGPTAIAFGQGQTGPIAKALVDYAHESRVLAIKGGILGSKFISAEDVGTLTTLPSEEELRARLLGGVQAPLGAFVGLTNAVLYQFVGLLKARAEQSPSATGETKEEAMSKEELIRELESMTVLDLVGLTKELEQRWGVSAAAPVSVAAAPVAQMVAAPPEEEEVQTEFTVILKEIGPNKINVIKTVREFTTLGLKEAKDLVEAAPKPVKESVTKEEAAAIKEKLEAAGAVAEVK